MTEIRESEETSPPKSSPEVKPEVREAVLTKRPKIETYHVLDQQGKDVLVADSAKGDQLRANPLEGGEILKMKQELVRDEEQAVLGELPGRPLAEKGSMARAAIEQSAQEYQDLQVLQKIFAEYQDHMMRVDRRSINGDRIPKDGRHFLIRASETKNLQSDLENLGYQMRDLENTGFEARRGKTVLIFIFAKEKAQGAEEQKDLRGQDLEEAIFASKSLIDELRRRQIDLGGLAQLEKLVTPPHPEGTDLKNRLAGVIASLEEVGRSSQIREPGLREKWIRASAAALALARQQRA